MILRLRLKQPFCDPGPPRLVARGQFARSTGFSAEVACGRSVGHSVCLHFWPPGRVETKNGFSDRTCIMALDLGVVEAVRAAEAGSDIGGDTIMVPADVTSSNAGPVEVERLGEVGELAAE